MANNYLRVYVHLIWKTWDKLPLLVPDVQAIVYPILLDKAQEHGAKVLAIGGVEDHVHVLMRLPSTETLATLVKEMKGTSARHVHLRFAQHMFKWQGGYGATSVSPSAIPEVTRYIENQADHHRRNYLDVELETVEIDERDNAL